jgi:uncharacterized protein YbbC (DUF1343 family)
VPARRSPLQTGLERLLATGAGPLRGARVGLLTHAAAVDATGRHAADLLAGCTELHLVRLFAPEHGVRGEHVAGAAVPHGRDGPTGLPVLSLYGAGAAAWEDGLRGLDAVLVDLQDIGCRYFTYAGTVRRLLLHAQPLGIPVHVLDRPNPLGGAAAGPAQVAAAWRSLVAALPVPVRHGLTLGELAVLAAREEGMPEGAVVVWTTLGWRGRPAFRHWQRPWVPPSPNATCPAMAELYPGTCLIEGTSLSEGRGTPYPFRQIGAPWLDGTRLAERLRAVLPRGLTVRPTWFIPTASKHAGQSCQGVFLDVLPGAAPPPDAGLVATVRLLQLLHADGAVAFPTPAAAGTEPPWLDRLLAGADLRQRLQEGSSCEELLAAWRREAAGFAAHRPVDLYGPGGD